MYWPLTMSIHKMNLDSFSFALSLLFVFSFYLSIHLFIRPDSTICMELDLLSHNSYHLSVNVTPSCLYHIWLRVSISDSLSVYLAIIKINSYITLVMMSFYHRRWFGKSKLCHLLRTLTKNRLYPQNYPELLKNCELRCTLLLKPTSCHSSGIFIYQFIDNP